MAGVLAEAGLAGYLWPRRDLGREGFALRPAPFRGRPGFQAVAWRAAMTKFAKPKRVWSWWPFLASPR